MRELDWKDLDPRRTLILVVDLQNYFCHERSVLKRRRARNMECAFRVYQFLEEARRKGVETAFSQQIYDESKLTPQQKKYYAQLTSGRRKTFGAYKGRIKIPCMKGSFGAEYFSYMPPKDRLFVKNNFDIWQNKKLEKFLAERKIETLIITGVEIVCCILYAILGAEERGYKIFIPRDLVSGVDEGMKDQKNLLKIINEYYGSVVPSKEIVKIRSKYY